MRRCLPVVLAVLLSLPAGAGAAASAGAAAATAGLPPGASVTRDAQGIAHVSARNHHDLYFTQGWVHAQDRLFQMDTRRRQADGTLAELLGPDALPSDVQLRTIGLQRAAARSLPELSPAARDGLGAYADGVNAWVASHPLPPEYAALELTRIRPWTALDSVAIGKLLAFGLSFDLSDIDLTLALLAYRITGPQAGFDPDKLFFNDLFRSQPFTPASTVPDAEGTAPRSGSLRPAGAAAGKAGTAARSAAAAERLGAVAELGRAYLAKAAQVPALRGALAGKGEGSGSNQWAVSGRKSASGRPMVANDPHLGLDQPSTFYPVHLRAGQTDVIGSGFAGVPAVIVGHNRFVTWGATVNPSDVTDVYVETIVPDPGTPSGLATVHDGEREPVVAIPETFRQNHPGSGQDDDVTVVPAGGSIPPATLIVPRRNQGPLIQLNLANGSGLSVQYTGFSATREIDTFLTWDDARGLDDFRRGLQSFDVGGQNWAYADTHGNIAYFTSAELPLREDLEAGKVFGLPPYLVRSGSGGNDWLPLRHRQPGQAIPYEILPAAEMPHTVNPRNGFFVNANNDPIGTTLDNDPLNQFRPTGGIYYLNPGYDGIRGGRITELLRRRLAHGGKASFGDLQRIQADTTLVDARFFVPQVLRALADAGRSGDPALAAFARDPGVREAVGRLRAWDGSTPTGIPEGYDAADVNGHRRPPSSREVRDSVAATIYAVWRSQFIHDVIDARLDALGSLPKPDGQLALTALKHLLETFDQRGGVGASGVDFFPVDGVRSAPDRRDVVILRSLQHALENLAGPAFAPAFSRSTRQDDYRWGRLHRVTLSHPIGGPFDVPPAGGAFPPPLAGLSGIPTDGGFDTVDAASHDARAGDADGFTFDSGPANRFVGRADRNGVYAESSLPGGTSGVPGTPFYLNLLPMWLTNDSFRLLN
jgi:penicillin amidase